MNDVIWEAVIVLCNIKKPQLQLKSVNIVLYRIFYECSLFQVHKFYKTIEKLNLHEVKSRKG